VLIFTNTKQAAFEISHRLELNGFKSKYIIGDLPQSKRLKIIDDMKSGKIPFLVATDVAARGLHIDDLELVINYDLPEDCENYVHRIGRTARAGKSGKAISLACERYVYGLEAIESFIDMKIPVVWADDNLFADDASKGKYFSLEKGKQKDPEWSEDDRPAKRIREKKTKKDVPAGHREKRQRTEKQTADTKRDNKGYKDKEVKKAAMPKSIRKSSLKKRLEYYNEKYGENFSVPAKAAEAQSAGRVSLLGRIKGFFKRKDDGD
jgi:ATP-dependent RNA helicase RhlB